MIGSVNDYNPDLVIDFSDVTFARDGRTLLGPLTWQVELDERWVVIGPNGAGKTTLMRIAGASDFPSSGTAFLMGEQLGKTDMRDLRAQIGISSTAVAQRIPPKEKVADLVISAGYAILGRWREEYEEMDYNQAIDILEQVGALHLRDRTWGTLSEGEKKRVMIARALMINPELLLLDEPGAGLDLGGREDLVQFLADLAADPDAPAVVMVTHHVEEIPPASLMLCFSTKGRWSPRVPSTRSSPRRISPLASINRLPWTRSTGGSSRGGCVVVAPTALHSPRTKTRSPARPWHSALRK